MADYLSHRNQKEKPVQRSVSLLTTVKEDNLPTAVKQEAKLSLG